MVDWISLFLFWLRMLKSLDQKPVGFSVNFDSHYTNKTHLGGLLSLIYFLLVTTIFFFKFLDLVQRNHLTFTTNIMKEDDLQDLDISSGDFRLELFRADQLYRPIKVEELGQYGVRVRVREHGIWVSGGKAVDVVKEYDGVGCQDGRYKEYEVCVPSNLTMKIKGRLDFSKNDTDGQKFRNYQIELIPCDPFNPTCKNFSQQMFFLFSLINNIIDPSTIDPNSTITKSPVQRIFQSFSPLKKSQNIGIEIFLKRAIIQTQNSIWPQIFHSESVQTVQNWFYDQQYSQVQIRKQPNVLLSVMLSRSTGTHVFRRRYERFDEMLGQVFGMLGLISFGVFGIYRGYNSWCFQQVIRERLGLEAIKPTIWKYYGVVFRGVWRKIRCWGRKDEEMLKEQEERKLLDSKLDYLNLINSQPYPCKTFPQPQIPPSQPPHNPTETSQNLPINSSINFPNPNNPSILSQISHPSLQLNQQLQPNQHKSQHQYHYQQQLQNQQDRNRIKLMTRLLRSQQNDM